MRQFVNTIFISNNRPSFHLWWKENLVRHRKVSKYYETESIYLWFFSFLFHIFEGSLLQCFLWEQDNSPWTNAPQTIAPRTTAPQTITPRQSTPRILSPKQLSRRKLPPDNCPPVYFPPRKIPPQIIAPVQFSPTIIDLQDRWPIGNLPPRTIPIRVIISIRLCRFKIFYCLSFCLCHK